MTDEELQRKVKQGELTPEEAMVEIQRRVKGVLDGFKNQQNTPETAHAVRTQIDHLLTTMQQNGELPVMDLTPDIVEQSPAAPNTLVVRWTDPRKVEVLYEANIIAEGGHDA